MGSCSRNDRMKDSGCIILQKKRVVGIPWLGRFLLAANQLDTDHDNGAFVTHIGTS